MDTTLTQIRLLSLILVLCHFTVNAEQVEVYTESLPPFQLLKSNEIIGTATLQVKELLEASKLTYKLHIVPWARAYNIVKTTPNTLIYSLNRTADREDYFYWIRVVANINNSFLSLKAKQLNLTELNDAQHYITAVVRDSYAHGILLKNGFDADKNMYVVATIEQQVSLLLKGKVDFLFTDVQSVQYSLSQQNVDPNIVTVNYTDPSWSRDLYLAANIKTEPKILKQITTQLSAKNN